MQSGHSDNRSALIALVYYSCAKASRSWFSCSSGRLVEMISKSYCLSSSITLSGAVAPLVRAKQSRGPLRDLLSHLLDEVIVDPNVGHRTRKCSHPSPDRRTEEGDEEDQPEQEPPEGSTQSTRASCAV